MLPFSWEDCYVVYRVFLCGSTLLLSNESSSLDIAVRLAREKSRERSGGSVPRALRFSIVDYLFGFSKWMTR